MLLVFQTAVYNEMSELGLMNTHQEVRYLTTIMVQHYHYHGSSIPSRQISIGVKRLDGSWLSSPLTSFRVQKRKNPTDAHDVSLKSYSWGFSVISNLAMLDKRCEGDHHITLVYACV